MNLTKITLGLIACGLVTSASAIPINPGFETGDLTGWTINGPGGANFGGAASGNFYGRVDTGLGAGVYTTLSQTFSMGLSESLSGFAIFNAGDYLPFDDNAFLSISGSFGSSTLWSSSVSVVGNFGSSGWQPWNFVSPSAGFYTLTLGVANSGDNSAQSSAGLDMGAAVPDAGSTAALLGGAFGLLALAGRRSRVKA